MTRYAETTAVSSDASRTEIEATLRRYGATSFAYGWEPGSAAVMFEVSGRRVRIRLPMPDRNDAAFTKVRRNQHTLVQATPAQAEKKWEQACRQSWRALALIIKAKLEAVAAGITTVEEEFLAHIVLPNNGTVGEWARPQLAIAYERGTMPALMPGGAS